MIGLISKLGMPWPSAAQCFRIGFLDLTFLHIPSTLIMASTPFFVTSSRSTSDSPQLTLSLALASATDKRFNATLIPTWVLQAALLALSQVLFGLPPSTTRIAFIDLVLLMPSSHPTMA
jgi:hypothetical protein